MLNRILYSLRYAICILHRSHLLPANFVPIDSRLIIGDGKDPIPSLSCVLFGNFGCNAQCTVVYAYSGNKAVGSCNAYFHCSCNSEESGADLIPKSFSIKPSTGNKKVGKSKGMNPDQYKRLKEYVVDELDEILLKETLPEVDYVANLVAFLENNKANSKIQTLYHQIRVCPNSNLHDVLDKFLKENGLKEKKLSSALDYLLIPNVLTDILIDELIVRIESVSENEESEESEGYSDTDEYLIPKSM